MFFLIFSEKVFIPPVAELLRFRSPDRVSSPKVKKTTLSPNDGFGLQKSGSVQKSRVFTRVFGFSASRPHNYWWVRVAKVVFGYQNSRVFPPGFGFSGTQSRTHHYYPPSSFFKQILIYSTFTQKKFFIHIYFTNEHFCILRKSTLKYSGIKKLFGNSSLSKNKIQSQFYKIWKHHFIRNKGTIMVYQM